MGLGLEELEPNASLSFCESTQKRVHGCVFDSRFVLYHSAVVLSSLLSISLAVTSVTMILNSDRLLDKKNCFGCHRIRGYFEFLF